MSADTERGSRAPLVLQVFVSILLVALSSVLLAGVFIRRALNRTFTAYLDGLPAPTGPGRGMGRRILGAAEQTFIGNVDRSIWIAALVAIVIAALAAYLLARRVSRPLLLLTASAQRFADGDLDERVAPDGPREVGELADAFNEMADSLSEAELLRRRLVADVAHELRNPIAALRAQLEGVSEGVIAMDSARADSLVADVGHLSRLVDDLQTLSVVEAGGMPYVMQELDLVALVEQVVERFAPLLSPGVELAVDARCSRCDVIGDELRLASVVRNLLSNAARHTREGSITVVLDRRADLISLEVRDTGEGIPAEDLPYVFERFYRADAARAADTGGAGIGLAIAKRVIEDHHGRMFAESEPGQGASVGFELPALGA